MEGYKIDFGAISRLKVEPGLFDAAIGDLSRYYDDQIKAMVGAIRLKFEARRPWINERGIAWDSKVAYFGRCVGGDIFRTGIQNISLNDPTYSWVALSECQNEERSMLDTDVALKVVREYQIQAKQYCWPVSVDWLVAWLERGGK